MFINNILTDSVVRVALTNAALETVYIVLHSKSKIPKNATLY